MKKISIISNGNKNIFIELVRSIEESIIEISDYKTSWLQLNSKNRNIYSDINIVVYGRHLSPPKNSYNILIQTEQNKKGISLNKYNLVLDLFKSKNEYFPLGYSKFFDCSYKKKEEDIDFLFCGGQSKRRQEIIDKYNIRHDGIIFGSRRNDLINRTKWNVNIKDDENWHYTPLRGILIMSKGKVLLQEITNNYGYHDPYLIKFNKENLLEVANKWGDKKRKDFGMYVKESLMKKPFKDIFLNKLRKVGIK